jgi:hypothetical protein
LGQFPTALFRYRQYVRARRARLYQTRSDQGTESASGLIWHFRFCRFQNPQVDGFPFIQDEPGKGVQSAFFVYGCKGIL